MLRSGVMRGRAALLIGSVLLAGCGGVTQVSLRGKSASSPNGSSGTTTTIGFLASPDTPSPSLLPLPPIARDPQDLQVIACQNFRSVTANQPYYPTDFPAAAGRPVCFIQGSANTAGQFDAGVLYVPNAVSPNTSSYIDAIQAGGLLIEETIHPSSSTTLAPASQASDSNSNGALHAKRTTIRDGQAAYVRRTSSNFDRISVEWFETDNTAQRVLIQVQGTYTPDKMYSIAQSLTQGTPPNELTVVEEPSTTSPGPIAPAPTHQ